MNASRSREGEDVQKKVVSGAIDCIIDWAEMKDELISKLEFRRAE
jgi:hypothetical protein